MPKYSFLLATCAWFGSNQLKRIDLMNLIPKSRDWLMVNSGDDNNIRVYSVVDLFDGHARK